MDRPFGGKTMKVTKYALVIGAALGAVSANAQFGAVSKSDLDTSGGKQGVYLSYSPFARFSGGGSSSNGYMISAEKAISEGKNGPNVLGAFYSRVGGSGFYQISYRMYMTEDASVALGILGGDGFSKNDFSAMYFKELPKSNGNPLMLSVGGGIYYDSSNSSANLSAAVKASYPVQNGFSVDASFWYFHQGGDSGNLFTLGIGYRM
jgi:hypothetical protein